MSKKLQTTAYRKNRNGNQTNEMERIFQETKQEKNNQQRYGLCSFKIPPPLKELAAFEFELIELVKNIQF